MYKHGLCAFLVWYIYLHRYFVVALDLISTWLFRCLSSLQQLWMTLGCNSFMTAISDSSCYVHGTSTPLHRICPGSVGPLTLLARQAFGRRKPVTCWPIFNSTFYIWCTWHYGESQSFVDVPMAVFGSKALLFQRPPSSVKHHWWISPVVEIDSLLFGWRVYDPGQTNPNSKGDEQPPVLGRVI